MKAAKSKKRTKKPSGSVTFSVTFRAKKGPATEATARGVKAVPLAATQPSKRSAPPKVERITLKADKSVAKKLSFSPSSNLVATIEDGALVIRPTEDIKKAAFERRVTRLMDAHDGVLRRLAE